jgi:hypothetical protein
MIGISMQSIRKVLVIGDPSYGDSTLNEIHHNVTHRSPETDQTIKVLRCCHSKDLVEKLSKLKHKIDILDIVDHGRPGSIHIGDDMLFESDEYPDHPLKGCVSPSTVFAHLSELAHIRLLGCNTAVTTVNDPAGRMLLLKLAKALGPYQVAYGTLAAVEPEHFNETGFLEGQARGLLFSSLAALESEPPSHADRQFNVGRLWARVRC